MVGWESLEGAFFLEEAVDGAGEALSSVGLRFLEDLWVVCQYLRVLKVFARGWILNRVAPWCNPTGRWISSSESTGECEM